MKISTTITKKYFEMKMQDLATDGFFIEFKEDTKFWNVRFDEKNVVNRDDLEIPIIFLVGSIPHCFVVKSIDIVHLADIPDKYKSAITTEHAYAIKCVL